MNDELLKQHTNLIELVKTGVLIPGKIDKIDNDVIYTPITIAEFLSKIEKNDITDLGYNTKTMGRGVFTVDASGAIVNYKGVDSHLKDEDNIAVQKTNSIVYDVSDMLGVGQDSPYKITVMVAEEQSPEIRVRGASQFQNLLNEKEKSDSLRAKDKKGLIKFPKIAEVKALCSQICERFHLPQNVKIDEEFLQRLEEDDRESQSNGGMGNYALYCLKYMQDIGLPIENRSQTWEEYFSSLSEEQLQRISSIPNLENAKAHQDSAYELGAMFGQATRILETPFRIMELDYYIDNNKLSEIKAILNYENGKRDGKFLEYYAETTAKDLAGLMNNNISVVNWVHRQDYSLSGELCDDAYDDISPLLEDYNGLENGTINDPSKNKAYYYADRFYGQIYLFASNMRIIENAYKLSGMEVPNNYQDIFFENLLNNIDDKQKFIDEMRKRSQPLEFLHKNRERQMFEGFEEYIDEFKTKFENYIVRNFEDKDKNTYGTLSFSEQEIGKATINTTTDIKDKSQARVDKDQEEIQALEDQKKGEISQ